MEDLIPFMLMILLLAFVFGFILFVSQVMPVKVLVAAAARNCARAGIETLDAGRGVNQALVTAVETAGISRPDGLAVDPAGLAVTAYTQDVWGRGEVFVCETGYDVQVGHLPLVGLFYSRDSVPLRARVALSIEPYKSRWGEE